MEFNRTNYEKMLDELFARHPSVQKDGFTAGAYKPGLGGMMEFDARLGSPWRNFKTIHVAGTNGKGSVCSMLAAALAANGYKVGLYTSPHLIDFRERAKIIENGGWRMISEEEVWDFVNGHELEDLSFFEITTGLAFSWFASQQVDIAVIETGLGGRLDSTNIITPELCIITSIGLDHCKMLGSTRAEIAAEKAGIFKPGVPAVVSSISPGVEGDTQVALPTRSITSQPMSPTRVCPLVSVTTEKLEAAAPPVCPSRWAIFSSTRSMMVSMNVSFR